jgi:pimeloyl-ACP methyl ester carboxylesterase
MKTKFAKFLLLLCLGTPLTLWPQLLPNHRLAYTFAYGAAYSAAAELPAFTIIPIGPDYRPRGITDQGTVLLSHPEEGLFRWQWGHFSLLLSELSNSTSIHLDSIGRAYLAQNSTNAPSSVRYWLPDGTTPIELFPGFLTLPHGQGLSIRAINDRGQFILSGFCENGLGAGYSYLSRDAFASIDGEFEILASSASWYNADQSFGSNGDSFEAADLNNYGDVVGLYGHYHATAGPLGWPYIVHSDVAYFTKNFKENLEWEPVALNDAHTLISRKTEHPHTLMVSDALGARSLQSDPSEHIPGKARLSNPNSPFEEIVLKDRYWKRMMERDFSGNPNGTPSPEFYETRLIHLVTNPENWSELEADCISPHGLIAGRATYTDPLTAETSRQAVMLFPVIMVPNWNRDGTIDQVDRLLTAQNRPWYFWVNDDDDDGDVARSYKDDLPQGLAGSGSPDGANTHVDGLRDCIDFFPLHLNLQSILRGHPDASNLTVKLTHAEGALNVLLSNLTPERVQDFYRYDFSSGFGPLLKAPAASAEVIPLDSNGYNLPLAYLNSVRDANKGLLFLEAKKATNAPLKLTIHLGGQLIYAAELPLRIGPVKSMFRTLNLTQADEKFAQADPGPWATALDNPPNLPDEVLQWLLPPLRTLIHIHGFNWTAAQTPAAHSEVFKRLFQAGSMARFIGVTWFGSEGLFDLAGSSFDYNENVINALITAAHLVDQADEFLGFNTTLLAHSLGGMVASSVAADYNTLVGRCLLINAAIPTEAFVGETLDRRLMVHPSWKDQPGMIKDYPERLLPTHWSKLFPSDDKRSRLSWKSRYASLATRLPLTNFYSSAEDILRPGDGSIPNLLTDVVGETEFIWTYNEMVKGTPTLAATLTNDRHGGWAFNRDYMSWEDPNGPAHPPAGYWDPMAPITAGALPDQSLRIEPFFRPFSSGDADFPEWANGAWLYGESSLANDYLPNEPLAPSELPRLKNQAKILAEAIPAHSKAAGAAPLENLPYVENIDLDTAVRKADFWPQHPSPHKRNRWLHGDYLNPAFNYVQRLFQLCVDRIHRTPF